MVRIFLVCVCSLSLTSCDWFTGPAEPPKPPVDDPGPGSSQEPVFVRHFKGESNLDFAAISLYRNNFLQTRLVLEVIRMLDSVNLDLALPECLKLAGGSNTGSYQWRGTLVMPGTYERLVNWEQYKPDCPLNGALTYTISSGPIGESGSISFEWPASLMGN